MAVTVYPETDTYRVVCHECESDLRFSWSDVDYNKHLFEYTVECPMCLEKLVLAGDEAAAEVIKHLRELCRV